MAETSGEKKLELFSKEGRVDKEKDALKYHAESKKIKKEYIEKRAEEESAMTNLNFKNAQTGT